MELTENDKGTLLTAARDSIKALYENLPPLVPDYSQYPNLKVNAGAFVTLKVFGQLRGCIGYIISKTSVFETVCNAAVQAAIHDPRFFLLLKMRSMISQLKYQSFQNRLRLKNIVK